MKKLLVLALLALFLLSLASCAKDPEIDMQALSGELAGANLFVDELVSLSHERILSVVDIDVSSYEYAEFHTGSGNTGEEYGLFTCSTKEDAEALVGQLEARRDLMSQLYAGYAAEVVPLIDGTEIRQAGRYVVYIGATEQQKASTILDTYFT